MARSKAKQTRKPATVSPALLGVAVSGADRWLAGAQDNGLVTVWQPTLARMLGNTAPMLAGKGHEGRVCAVAFVPKDLPSSNGTYQCVVSGGVDATIRTWHLADKTKNATLRHHQSSVMCVAFDKAGERLVTGSEDQTIAIYHWDEQRLERTFRAHDGTVLGVAVSPDGKRVASGGFDGRAYLWSMAGKRLARLDDDETYGTVWAVRFLDDDRIVFTKGTGLYAWSKRAGTKRLYTAEDPLYQLHGLAVRADRKQLAFGHRNAVITIDLPDHAPRVRSQHTGEVNAVAYFDDGSLASVGDDGLLCLWDAASPAPILELRASTG